MSFKEFKELISNGEKLRSKLIGIHGSERKVFSEDFEKFIKSQKVEIASSLEPILSAGKKQIQVIESDVNFWNGYVSQDLLNIQAHQALLVKEQQNYQQKVEASQRAKALVQKNDENLKKAQEKKNAVDIHKYESQVEPLRQACEDAERAQEQALNAYNEYYDQYKLKFLDILSSDLYSLVDFRQKQAEQLSTCADEILNSIQTISAPPDAFVENLQKKLQDLEEVVIE